MTDAERSNISDTVYHLTHTGAFLCVCGKKKTAPTPNSPNVNVTHETRLLCVYTAKYMQYTKQTSNFDI